MSDKMCVTMVLKSVVFVCLFWYWVSYYNWSGSGTHYVSQAVLRLCSVLGLWIKGMSWCEWGAMWVWEQKKTAAIFFFFSTAGLVAFRTEISLKKLASPFQLQNLVNHHYSCKNKNAQIKKVTYIIIILRSSNRIGVIQFTRVKLYWITNKWNYFEACKSNYFRDDVNLVL